MTKPVINAKKAVRYFAFFLIPILVLLSIQIFVSAGESDEILKNMSESRNYITLDEEKINLDDINLAGDIILDKTGTASYYAHRFHNRRTANGERYNMHELTAAHKTLPFGTILRITNLKNDKKVLVRINDRGPYVGKRIIDLSLASAKAIEGKGLPAVRMEGFIAEENFAGRIMKSEKFDSTETYFFGYSYDKDLICVPSSALVFADTDDEFEQIVNKYNDFLAENPDKHAFISVRTDIPNRRESSKSDYRYHVAVLTDNISVPDRGLLASKNEDNDN
ncbi:MAG: septal ring lytic transglycosylase RlpA family protein [Candidatus Kapaibacterium sp.]